MDLICPVLLLRSLEDFDRGVMDRLEDECLSGVDLFGDPGRARDDLSRDGIAPLRREQSCASDDVPQGVVALHPMYAMHQLPQ